MRVRLLTESSCRRRTGTYVLVDHSLSRLTKGAAGHLVVTGAPNDNLYDGGSTKGTGTSAAH